jgi:hypothetical protein
VDNEQREKLEREQLELARAKLDQEQRARLEGEAKRLREAGHYAARHEAVIADVIYENRAHVHQRADIDAVHARAQFEAKDRELKEQQAARVLELRAAEERKREIALEQQQRETEARDREQREVQAREKHQREAEAQGRQAAARREPVPGSVQKFNDHLGRQAGEANDTRPLSANEVHSRFGDPALEARYRRSQQERNPRDYSDLSRPLTASELVERSNTPAEKIIEPPATREKFIREVRDEKFTRESRDGKITRSPRDRDSGRDRDDGRDQ